MANVLKPPLGHARLMNGDPGGNEDRRQTQHGRTDAHAIAPDELHRAVCERVRSCPDRLVTQIPAKVFRERVDRSVTLLRAFLEPLPHDRVEIATKVPWRLRLDDGLDQVRGAVRPR